MTWLYVIIALLKCLFLCLAILGINKFCWRLSSKRFLYWVIGGGFLCRVLWIVVVDAAPLSTGDSEWYHRCAVNLIEGQGISIDGHPTARFGPSYIVFLAFLYKFLGSNPIIGQMANLLLSSGMIFLTYAIALELYDISVARMAAILMAIFPGQIPFASALLSEPLFGILFFTGFLLSIRKVELDSWQVKAFLTGVLYAAAALTRPVVFLYLPLNPLLMYLRGTSIRKTILVHVIVLFGIIGILSPWIYRNYNLFHRFIPATTAGGLTLWQGNNLNSTGMSSDAGVQPFADIQDEPLRDSLAREEALAFVRNNPKRFLTLLGAKLYRTYEVDIEIAYSSLQSGRDLPASLSLGYLKFSNTFFNAIMLLFFVYLTLPFFRTQKFNFRVWVTVIIPVVYFACMQAIFVAQDRYKYPTVPFIAIGVAVVLSKLPTAAKALWKVENSNATLSAEQKVENVDGVKSPLRRSLRLS